MFKKWLIVLRSKDAICKRQSHGTRIPNQSLHACPIDVVCQVWQKLRPTGLKVDYGLGKVLSFGPPLF